MLVATSAVGCRGGGRAEPEVRSRYAPATLPAGPIGLYAEGVMARRAGDGDRALQLLLTAVQRDQQLIMANQVIGELYTERGDPAAAQPFFERLLRLDPDTPRNHFRLGYTYEQLRRFGDAAASYLNGLKIDADDPAGNVGLGRTYLALGRPADARPYLETATRLDPDSGEAWLNLGRSLDAVDALGAAESAYRRALETLPAASPTLVENLGLNLVRQGKGNEAVPLLQQAVDADPSSPAAHKNLGDAFIVDKQYADAVAQYDAALAVDADFVPAINAKGTAFILQYQQGASLDDALRERALASWRRSLELEPEQPLVKQAVARFEQNKLFN